MGFGARGNPETPHPQNKKPERQHKPWDIETKSNPGSQLLLLVHEGFGVKGLRFPETLNPKP